MLFFLNRGVDQAESVSKQISLNLRVQRRIAIKRWRMVDFKQAGVAILVDQDVKSKDFKAHAVVYVTWLARSIVMDQVGLNGNQSFDYHITHFPLEYLNIYTISSNSDEYAIQGPLVACLCISRRINFVVGVVLVDGVVCEMYEWIVEGFELVFLGCKSRETVFENEDSQRLDVGDQNVDAEIPFVTINEKWVLDVFLYY